jgi:hypothetical protein
MGVSEDYYPGTRKEQDMLFIDDGTTVPATEGFIAYRNGAWIMVDSEGEFDPRSGSGLSEAQHRALDHLVHFMSGGGPGPGIATQPFYQKVGSILFPTSIIWWVDTDRTKKIYEKILTRTGEGTNLAPNPITHKTYKTDGNIAAQAVEVPVYYNGIFRITATRTFTLY